ncbi:MAG: type IV toxin-antitoxin system AbiEi family antitoxin domain-containing protein [Paracoccaceae bacterium]
MKPGTSKKQRKLAALIKKSGNTIRIDDAVRVFDIDRQKAAKLLAGWHNQGNLRRISHGLYVPVNPTALGREQVLDDPWVIVDELYAPGYVGGWSALEYWGLTEQLFRSVCVLTAKRTKYGERTHQGVSFFVKHIPENQLFGTKAVWREQAKIQLSDLNKTVLDIVDDPDLGAGLQHVTDVLKTYLKDHATRENLELLLSHADKTGNGALYKKLGYLSERCDFPFWFIEECHNRRTQGYAFLGDRKGDNRLVTKWRLWVPKG